MQSFINRKGLKRILHFLGTVLGAIFVFLGGILSSSQTFELLGDKQDAKVSHLIAFSLILVFGAILIKINYFNPRQLLKREEERIILQMISRKLGKITPIEIAAETPWSIDESKAFLDKMKKQGHCSVELTNSGEILYVFSGLVTDEEKETSQDPTIM